MPDQALVKNLAVYIQLNICFWGNYKALVKIFTGIFTRQSSSKAVKEHNFPDVSTNRTQAFENQTLVIDNK